MQLVVENELLNGIERYGAIGGTVIVLDPETAGVLAMATYPNYDPSDYTGYSDQLFKNPAVSSSFEPGSIFKILVMASALDSGAVEPDTKCEVCGGPLKVDKYYIETWNSVYYPDSTMLDVIVNSDNVGMAWIAQQTGSDKLYEYLRKFGVGSLTGIDLQGEASPKLREKGEWSLVDLSTAGFGQGVATTPMQMITAVNVIANSGVIKSPRVVERVLGDGWEAEVDRADEKRVVSKKTAEQVKAMMVEAAKNGEAKWTHLRGFKVAGKTGTAQIPIEGHYDEERTIASFVGFAPADDPKFIMLVTLYEPTSSPWASETAAPLWYSIAKDLFLYFGIQPES
ncbi:penicillin-binding protein 2 [Patescibacteria group bacterium]|nr:penicillin-binding protein 2 [Patescibacteria group bacterium]